MISSEEPCRYLFARNVHISENTRIKDREKSEIFHAICTSVGATRKNVVDRLGIRPSTVSSVVTELIQDNLVYEGESASPGRKGRPEIYLHPQFNRLSAIAVYAVSRNFHAVLVSYGRCVLAERSRAVPREADEATILESISVLIREIRSDPAAEDTEILGVGLSLPGNLDVLRGRWLKSTRWVRVQDLSFESISRETGLPVRLTKSLDAECAYILRRFPDLSRGDTLLVHWGYGIGASYAQRGTVLHARAGTFGEIGHWTMDTEDPRECTCGDRGCLETRSAMWALLPGIRERYPHAPELEDEFSDFLAGRTLEEIPGIDTAIRYMAIALRNLYQLFYPDNIVLYGPFTERVEIFSSLSKAFHQEISQFSRRASTLRAYKMRSEGEVFGCTEEFMLEALRRHLVARWG